MKLRIEVIVGMAILSCGPSFAAEHPGKKWGPITNDTRIALVVKGGGAEIKVNQPFLLSMCVQNLSTYETVFVFHAWPPERDPFRTIRVLSPSGKDLLPRIPQGYAGSGASVSISPSDVKEFDFDLRKLCKLDEIGAYTVVVTSQVWRLSNRPPFTARSASLPIKIVPGRWDGPPQTNAPTHW